MSKYYPEYTELTRRCNVQRIKTVITILCCFVSAWAAAGAVDTGAPATQQSDAGHFQVSVTSKLTPIAINRMHSWLLHVDNVNGTPIVDAKISISGGMPDHDHGLPTAPKVTRNFNNGDYLVEGIKFHMNGRWEITISVEAAAVRDAVTFEFAL